MTDILSRSVYLLHGDSVTAVPYVTVIPGFFTHGLGMQVCLFDKIYQCKQVFLYFSLRKKDKNVEMERFTIVNI